MIENIAKSLSDDRQYRYLQLGNELNTLLINDPTTDTSAASMYVGVGSLNDPDDPHRKGQKFNGLAHFCEHMLFLGTKKYPDQNQYQKFLEENGGDSNAATGDDYTYFYFDVSNQKFGEALDIFSQFFKEPLFNKDAMDREMKAIDSEYQLHIQDEPVATDQLEKEVIAVPGSIVSRFLIGNLETLKVDGIYDQLKTYYEDNYSSNRMNLVLVGNQTLDELQSMAV